MAQSPAKDKIKGVQWFKHFPTNFVRPYGPTVAYPSDETIWNRLQTFNCELLQRPKVGISELASSIEPTLKSLLHSNCKLINDRKLTAFIEQLQSISDSLSPLEKASGVQVEEKHVVNMLKQFYQDNDEVTSMVHEAFIVGSTLYTMAIQFLVANAVFHDPQQYARMVPMTALGAKQFKENPSVKGMKKFLTTNMVTSATGPTAGQKNSSSLLAQLEDDSDSDNDLFATPEPLSQTASTSVASSGDLSHSDDITPAVSQRRKRSREVQEVTNEESELTQTKKQKKNKKKKGKC